MTRLSFFGFEAVKSSFEDVAGDSPDVGPSGKVLDATERFPFSRCLRRRSDNFRSARRLDLRGKADESKSRGKGTLEQLSEQAESSDSVRSMSMPSAIDVLAILLLLLIRASSSDTPMNEVVEKIWGGGFRPDFACNV